MPNFSVSPRENVVSTQVQQGDARSSIASSELMRNNVVGGVSPNVTFGPTQAKKSCMYNKKGRCKEHGDGAKGHYKPIITTEEGLDGKVVRKLTKKLYWVCHLGPVGNKNMTQTRLSFTGTPLRMTQGNNVHTQQGDLDNSMTCKEGQNTQVGAVQTGKDEK